MPPIVRGEGLLEEQIGLGDDANQSARLVDHRQGADPVFGE